MVKRVLTIGLLLLVSLGIVKGVTSYSSAEVTNEVSLRIVASEDALIGVPKVCNIGEIELVPDVSNYQEPIKITNNMSKTIRIWLENKNDSGITFSLDESINSGCQVPQAIIGINITNQAPIDKPIQVPVIFKATWNGGNAEIESLINLMLTVPPEENPDENSGDNTSSGDANLSELPETMDMEDSSVEGGIRNE